jgi:DNA-binding CsgD family transcriptional regulator
MSTQKLLEVTNYLASAPRSAQDIASHLAITTFSDEQVQIVYVGMLEPDGNIHHVAHFGYSDADCEGPIDILLRHNTPIQLVLKTSHARLFQSNSKILETFTDGYRYPSPKNWRSLAIFPIGDFGVIAIFFANNIDENPEVQLHLQTLGALIGMHLTRYKDEVVKDPTLDHQLPTQSNSSMTERQIVILKMIERGLTNAEIAKEVGYSESLVRQETVHIFRKLKVTGRKQILNHSGALPEKNS